MKKLVGITLLIVALTGCGVTESIDAKDAALGFRMCQVFQVNPISIVSHRAGVNKSRISHSVTAYCEGGIAITLDIPYEKDNPKGDV